MYPIGHSNYALARQGHSQQIVCAPIAGFQVVPPMLALSPILLDLNDHSTPTHST